MNSILLMNVLEVDISTMLDEGLDDVKMTIGNSQMQGRPSIIVTVVHIDTSSKTLSDHPQISI